MLESIRKGQRWLTLIFVGVIGLVFAAFIGLGGPLSGGQDDDTVVNIAGRQLGIREFGRIRAQQESRFREAVGDQFDADAAASYLDSQALRSLVDGAVLAHAAEELGLRVSAEEIQRTVRSFAGFRDASGNFDREGFISQVEYEYGSQRNFLSTLRADLLRQKLARVLYTQASVSDTEARDAALYRLEEVKIAYVDFDTQALPPGMELSDEEVDAYAAAHEEELRARFEERSEEFKTPEKVRARHILFRVEKDASEEAVAQARARAEAALAEISAGASFEDKALELSDDPGTKQDGGDLGFFARGETTPAVEEAAFALQVGETSSVVRSEAGFHIVRLEEHLEAGTKPFESVRQQLARDGAVREAAARRAEELSEKLASAIRAGESLEEAARQNDLTLERTAGLRRRADGFLPGLGRAPEVLTTAFALDLEHASSARIFPVDSRLVLIQLLERTEIDEQKIAEAAALEKDRLLEADRNSMLQDWIDRRRDALAKAGQLQVNASLVLEQ